MVRLLQN